MIPLAFVFMMAPAAWGGELPICNSAETQLQLNQCAAQELAAADQKLNEVYQALLKKEAANSAFIEKLRIAQRAWVSFRDAELAATFACASPDPQQCWGSMFPMSYGFYKTKLTRERTQRLQALLDNGQAAQE